jgi:flavodoxin I
VDNIADTVMGASDVIRRRVLHVVYASTSGHTEYVVDVLVDYLTSSAPGWEIQRAMAERTGPQDLLRGDVLLLASSTWDAGGVEGQLNPHMSVLLQEEAKSLDLGLKPCACIALGDDRYLYVARAADHLERYVRTHHGRPILPTLKIINEPYGQTDTVRLWAKRLLAESNQVARA